MNDKNTITRIKFFFDLEKEIAYINEMNKNGWKLVYIKGGFCYIFEKSYPDEYLTLLHSTEKEKISSLAAFAAQCGYENIPHTMDGAGDLLYLTGKKAEVSEDFVIEREDKIKMLENIGKKYAFFAVAYYILFAALVLEAALLFYLFTLWRSTFLITTLDVIGAAAIFILAGSIKLSLLIHRNKKKIKALQSEGELFE